MVSAVRGRLARMCGRYAATANPDDLVEEFEVDADQTGGELQPRYNLAPTDPAPVVVERTPKDEPEASPERTLRLLTWGLVPSWAKDRSVGNRMINARADTVLEKPAYKRAALARRCLVPADGWYEWQKSPTAIDAKGKPRRQPFFTRLADGERLAFAGLFEFWRDDSRPDGDPLAWLTTYAIITTEAELEAFYIVKSLLRQAVDSKRVGYRDSQSYFAILLDDNNRKTVCRLYLGGAKEHLCVLDDNKKEMRYELSSLDDIYRYSEVLLTAVARLEKLKAVAVE